MIVTAPTLTNAGKGLLLRGIAGETITFTRFKIGSGRLGGRVIEEMTDLVTVKKAFNITKMDSSEAGVLKLQGRFDSTDITTAFVWRELGIFAHGEDGTELLYAYANDGDSAQTLPTVSSDVAVTQIVTMAISIGEAQNVTAEFDPDPEYASSADLLALQAQVAGTGWQALTEASGISEGLSNMGLHTGSPVSYRIENGHHVYIHLNVALTYTAGNSKQLTSAALPPELIPESRIIAFGTISGSENIGRFYIASKNSGSDGLIYLERAYNLASGQEITNNTQITWTDAYIEYFI